MYESTDKMVSHPPHYQSPNGLEVIDVIESFTADLKGVEATDTGNIIKYACRWKNKNGIQDLEKILWYTQHLIEHLKSKEETQYSPIYVQYCYDYECLLFDDRRKAETVLKKIDEITLIHGVVSVADLCDLVGITGNCINTEYGWTRWDISRSFVKKIPNFGYTIEMPKVIPIIKYIK